MFLKVSLYVYLQAISDSIILRDLRLSPPLLGISYLNSTNKFWKACVLWTYPRIIANESSLEKYAAPGSTVTVSFPVEKQHKALKFIYHSSEFNTQHIKKQHTLEMNMKTVNNKEKHTTMALKKINGRLNSRGKNDAG